MTIKCDKIYTFDLTGRFSFGNLPEVVLVNLYKDGRVASKMLEHQLPHWFPELSFVDKTGYDHVDVNNSSYKFELKCFTKRGTVYAPSNMVGKGRKIVLETVYQHAANITYVFADINDFPSVNIIFKKGVDLIQSFPLAKIKFKERNLLFNEQPIMEHV